MPIERDRNSRNSTKLDVCDIPSVLSTVASITATACENVIGNIHLSNSSHVWLSSGSSLAFGGISLFYRKKKYFVQFVVFLLKEIVIVSSIRYSLESFAICNEIKL